MERIYRIALLLGVVLAMGVEANAQMVNFVEPKEDSSVTVSPDKVKIIVNSNSDKMEMSHNMGDGKGVRTTNDDGTYRYTIDYSFPEDHDDDFIKSTFLVRLPVGQKDFMLILRKGKAYVGTFNENFIIKAEKNNDGIFPQSKSAKVTFLSAMKKLNIECNGKVCFIEGNAVPVNGANITTSVKPENDAVNAYTIEFMLDEDKKTATFIKHPVFTIKAGYSNNLEVDLGGDLEYKKSYSYTVVSNVKIVEKEATFEELVAKAQAKEKEYDFFAAATAYEDARSHKACPVDRRSELESQLGRVNSARRFLFYAEKFESQGAMVEQKQGFTADSVFIYYRGAIRSYKKVLEYAPDATKFKNRIEELDAKLKDHPLNTKVTTVAVKYQEVTGKHPNGGGIPIYASNTENKPKDTKDQKPLSTTRSDGSFRIVFKTAPPSYIYFFGDKKSYKIDSTTTEIIF